MVRFHTENKSRLVTNAHQGPSNIFTSGLGIFVIVDPDGAKYVPLSHILISSFPPLLVNDYQAWRLIVPYNCQVRVKPCRKDDFMQYSAQDIIQEKSIRTIATASISKYILKTTLVVCLL